MINKRMKKFVYTIKNIVKSFCCSQKTQDKLVKEIDKLYLSRFDKLNATIAYVSNKQKRQQDTLSKLYKERAEKNLALGRLKRYIEQQEIDIININLSTSQCENLILTTFPKFGSRNVGDAMITDSFIKLMREKDNDFDYVKVFRETSLELLDLKYIKNIYMPGMTVSPGCFPKFYRLFKDTDRFKDFNLIPVACSFQNIGERESSYNVNYSARDLDFLQKIVDSSGPIQCRDKKIVELLGKNGIKSEFFGDLVLFDEDFVSQNNMPENIKSVAFSIQHSSRYNEQSISIMRRLRSLLGPDTKIYVTFHSEENGVTDWIRKHTSSIENLEYIALSGESSELDFYNSIDLHIGFRLHGHISFLRRRKPSILFSEDVRSYGFLQTPELCRGIFDATLGDPSVNTAFAFLENELVSNFESYVELNHHIDVLHKQAVEKLEILNRK